MIYATLKFANTKDPSKFVIFPRSVIIDPSNGEFEFVNSVTEDLKASDPRNAKNVMMNGYPYLDQVMDRLRCESQYVKFVVDFPHKTSRQLLIYKLRDMLKFKLPGYSFEDVDKFMCSVSKNFIYRNFPTNCLTSISQDFKNEINSYIIVIKKYTNPDEKNKIKPDNYRYLFDTEIADTNCDIAKLAKGIIDDKRILNRKYIGTAKWVLENIDNILKYDNDCIAVRILRMITDKIHAPREKAKSQHLLNGYDKIEIAYDNDAWVNLIKILPDKFIQKICYDLVDIYRIPEVLHNINILKILNRMIENNPKYTNMVRYSMLYAMGLLNSIEERYNLKSVIGHTHIFSMDEVVHFPTFPGMPDKCHPYTPVNVKHMRFKIPNYLPGRRIPHDTKKTMERIDAVTVRRAKRKDVSLLNIISKYPIMALTGSRIGGSGFSGPIELERYDGDWDAFCEDYIGYPIDIMDKMISIYHKVAPKSDHGMFDMGKIEEAEQRKIMDLVDQLSQKSLTPTGLSEYKFSDIDLHINTDDDECYTNMVDIIVCELSKYGKVFKYIRKKESGRLSWTIVSECLNYPIDTFSTTMSHTSLISKYHSPSPRIFCDGYRVICTGQYVSARMSGASPYILTKSLQYDRAISIFTRICRHEQISPILNQFNIEAYKKYCAVAGIPFTLGAVHIDSTVYTGRSDYKPVRNVSNVQRASDWNVVPLKDNRGSKVNPWSDDGSFNLMVTHKYIL